VPEKGSAKETFVKAWKEVEQQLEEELAKYVKPRRETTRRRR